MNNILLIIFLLPDNKGEKKEENNVLVRVQLKNIIGDQKNIAKKYLKLPCCAEYCVSHKKKKKKKS